MIDFADLARRDRDADAWRAENPGPLVWVTSCRPGALFREFTEASPPREPVGPSTWHYIGRRMGDGVLHPESPLANPFRPHGGTSEARRACIAQYTTWLGERFHPGTPQWDELLNILRMALGPRGVALGCWCAPLPCHGDVVRAAVLSMYVEGWRG